jgi:hypothetical protein
MKTIQLTDAQYTFLIHCLQQYGDLVGGRVCDDLPKEIEALFTSEEGKAIEKEFALYNTHGANDWDGPPWPLREGCLTDWLRMKIEEQAAPTAKAPEIDTLLTSLTGISRQEAFEQKICAGCYKPATKFRDEESRKEFRISILCQACQDEIWG